MVQIRMACAGGHGLHIPADELVHLMRYVEALETQVHINRAMVETLGVRLHEALAEL